jgi:hypothetical protein
MSELNDALELPPHLAGWLTEYNNLKAQIKDLTERADIARAHLESALGDNVMATVNGVPVLKWDYVDSKRFNQKKAQQLLSEAVFQECFDITRSRVFRPISQDDL